MTKNQKILLGCGGSGLGLVVVAIIFFGFLGYTWRQVVTRGPAHVTDTSTEKLGKKPTPTAALSEDEKRRLVHAAGVTKDNALMLDVMRRVGLTNADGTPTPAFKTFMEEQISWGLKNLDFAREVNTPEKARQYVKQHLASSEGSAATSTPANSDATAVSRGQLNGKAISLPQPAYPPTAKAAKIQGPVVVQVIIDESGTVTSAQATSGHPLLRQAAVQAARSARSSPTLVSGRSVKVSGTLNYNFVLDKTP